MSAIPHVHKLTFDKWDMYSWLQNFLKHYGTSVEQCQLVSNTYLMSELIQSPNVICKKSLILILTDYPKIRPLQIKVGQCGY